MKNLLLFIFFLVLYSLASTGCDSIEPENDMEPLVPTAIGNTWVSQSMSGSGEFQVRISGTKLVHDTTFYVLQYDSFQEMISNGRTGLVYDSQATSYRYFFKYPAQDNERYTYPDPYQKKNYTVHVTRNTITVPAGSFNCFNYRIEELNLTFSFAPGIGLVRVQSPAGASALLRYELK